MFVRQWDPKGTPRFVACVAHGGAEHSGRYAGVAAWLTEIGGVVFAPDHRGQGQSDGTPGHIASFSVYGDDLEDVCTSTSRELPASCQPDRVPWFLYGHSMGALIALTYLLDRNSEHPFVGAICSAPLLGLAMKVPPLKRMVGELAARIVPRLTLPAGIPPEAISRDPDEVTRYIQDPHRVTKVSAQWFVSMNEAVNRVEQEISRLTLPMLWYLGTGDQICDAAAQTRIFHRLCDPSGNDQTLHPFDGYYHELHNEPELLRRPVRDLLVAWVSQRCTQVETSEV
ncbi:MAG: lysophospholipase [Nannocystaceae bacterium]